MELMGRKRLDSLGAQVQQRGAGGYSAFALRQMQKMGWTEGKGLGKHEDGITDNVKVSKREEAAGLGTEKQAMEFVSNQWWHGAIHSTLQKLSSKSKKKKKRSRDGENAEKSAEAATQGHVSYEDLFRATGGLRMGMRARASQRGKWERAENGQRTTVETETEVEVEVLSKDAEESKRIDSSEDAADSTQSKQKKKEKKEKKEKKSKKAQSEAEDVAAEEEEPTASTKKTKAKSKRSKNSSDESEPQNLGEVEVETPIVEETQSKKKRKKQKESPTDVESQPQHSEDLEQEDEDGSKKEKKKKRKKPKSDA